MLIQKATERECELLFRRRLERTGYRFDRYKKHYQRPKAAISLTQSNSNSGTASTLGCTLIGTVTLGDLVIIGINWGNNAGSYAVSDDAGAGNTYTEFPSNARGLTGNDLTAFWCVVKSTTATLTITITITGGGSHTMRLAAFDYASTVGWATVPVDKGNVNSSAAGNTSANAGNITPSVSGTLVWSAIQFGSVTSNLACGVSGANTFTERPTSGGTLGIGWRGDGRATSGDCQSADANAQTCPFTWSTASTFSAIIANFIAGSGGDSFQEQLAYKLNG